MEKEYENLAGKIRTVTTLLRPGCFGSVELDAPVDGLKYAIINDESIGRIALMNPTGRLVVGTRVTILKAKRRYPTSEALVVLALEAAA